jgi:hypothetical protein
MGLVEDITTPVMFLTGLWIPSMILYSIPWVQRQ